MPNISLRAVLTFVFLTSNVLTSPTHAQPSVTIEAGVVIGTATTIPSSTATVNKFLGIPFAAPPTRWSPSVPPKKWKTPLKATKHSPSCIQQFDDPKVESSFLQALFNTPPPPSGESEDCLYVDVNAPASPPPPGGRTVMFWIYGGALQFGSNSHPFYDGTSFAAYQDVIIVAPNYRSNVFGFPMSPQLPLTERNLGFLDQRLALQWARQNIHAFGGDPEKITIFGESAGAASVDEFLTTTPHNPPFRAAIMQSGQTSFYVNHNNSNTLMWDALMEALNCSSAADMLACARAADVSTIQAIEQEYDLYFRPVSDNVTQMEFPEAARVAGKVAQVPILVGTNANEGRVFTYGDSNTTTYLNSIFPGEPSLWSKIESAYPLGSSTNLAIPYYVDAAIDTDYQFQCPSAIVANDSHSTGNPTWRYFFNATFPNTQIKQYPFLGVYHFSEVPIVFGTFPKQGVTVEQKQLSRQMQKAWADFAKDPMKGPGWQKYPKVKVLESGVPERVVRASMLDVRCRLYEQVYEAEGIIG